MHQIRFPLGSCPSCIELRGLLLRGSRRRWKGRGRKCKGEGRGEEMEGGIWPTQKYWRIIIIIIIIALTISNAP